MGSWVSGRAALQESLPRVRGHAGGQRSQAVGCSCTRPCCPVRRCINVSDQRRPGSNHSLPCRPPARATDSAVLAAAASGSAPPPRPPLQWWAGATFSASTWRPRACTSWRCGIPAGRVRGRWARGQRGRAGAAVAIHVLEWRVPAKAVRLRPLALRRRRAGLLCHWRQVRRHAHLHMVRHRLLPPAGTRVLLLREASSAGGGMQQHAWESTAAPWARSGA